MTTDQNKYNLLQRLDNPGAFIAAMSDLLHKSPITGLATPGDAAVLAWHCLANNIDPLEFSRRYHVVGGKLAMRADYMHAAFRAAGGRIEWIATGDDGQQATGDFYEHADAKPVRVSFSIEDARKLLGRSEKHKCDAVDVPNSGWTKDRGAMLRARVISKGLRMVAPEVIAGVYTPEELETISVSAGAPDAPRIAESPAVPPRMIEAQATALPPVPAPAAIVTPAPTPAPAPEDDGELPTTTELIQELMALATKMQKPDGSPLTVAEVSQKLCAAAGVAAPTDAKRWQVRKLIAKVRDALSK